MKLRVPTANCTVDNVCTVRDTIANPEAKPISPGIGVMYKTKFKPDNDSEGKSKVASTRGSVPGCDDREVGVEEGARVTHICDSFQRKTELCQDDYTNRKYTKQKNDQFKCKLFLICVKR